MFEMQLLIIRCRAGLNYLLSVDSLCEPVNAETSRICRMLKAGKKILFPCGVVSYRVLDIQSL